MQENISPLGVISKSLSLFMEKKLTYIGFAVAPLAVMFAFFGLNMYVIRHMTFTGTFSFSPLIYVGFLAAFLFVWAYMLIFNHYTVTQMRGNPKAIPEALGSKLFHLFIFFLKFTGVMILISIPLGILFAVGMTVMKNNMSALTACIIVGIPVGIWAYVSIIRVLMVLPGIALGEMHKLRDGWKMTKGHGLRIFLSFLIFIVAFIILEGLTIKFGSSMAAITVLFIAQSILQMLSLIVVGIWYAKLYPAYRENIKQHSKPESTGDEVADLL